MLCIWLCITLVQSQAVRHPMTTDICLYAMNMPLCLVFPLYMAWCLLCDPMPSITCVSLVMPLFSLVSLRIWPIPCIPYIITPCHVSILCALRYPSDPMPVYAYDPMLWSLYVTLCFRIPYACTVYSSGILLRVYMHMSLCLASVVCDLIPCSPLLKPCICLLCSAFICIWTMHWILYIWSYALCMYIPLILLWLYAYRLCLFPLYVSLCLYALSMPCMRLLYSSTVMCLWYVLIPRDISLHWCFMHPGLMAIECASIYVCMLPFNVSIYIYGLFSTNLWWAP